MKVSALSGLAALLGIAVALGALPAALLPWTAGFALLLGLAWPLLLRATPTEPSALKLTVLSATLSLPLAAALFAGLGTWMPMRRAFVFVLGITALLQLVTPRKRVAHEPLGRAAWAVIGCAFVSAAIVATLALAFGSAPRLLPDGAAWHAGVADALRRGLPAENPWLAGEGLPAHPGYDALVATVSAGFGLSASRAMAWIGTVSLALLPVVLYLLAAPLWRDGKRTFCAPLLALFAWNAHSGLRLPFDGARLRWSEDLARLAPGVGGEVWYGLGAFFHPGPLAPALTACAAALLCAAHALRHGKRPWPLACALHAGIALALSPPLGIAVLAAILCASIVGPVPGGARARVVLGCALAAAPGAWLALRFGLASEPVRPHGVRGGPLAAFLPGLLPFALAVFAFRVPRAEEGAHDHSILVRLAWCGVLVPCALVLAGGVDPLDGPALLRLASLPLGVLAAGAFAQTRGGDLVRKARIAVCVLTLVGGLHATGHALRAHVALARTPLPVADADGVVTPTSEAQEELGRAYAWLRTAPTLRAEDAILARSVAIDSGRFGGTFTPHFAALFADLSMWCDRRGDLSRASGLWATRHEGIQKLYRDRSSWDPRMTIAFERAGRPIVFVVEERDRVKTLRGGAEGTFRGIDGRLQRLGCERIHVEGSVALYRWDPRGGDR
ncbi:MAG: hypothetical protein GY711_24705 [bacterium]|nr:hypothetical protein [bacterium]